MRKGAGIAGRLKGWARFGGVPGVVLAVALGASAATPAQAAGFDCARAQAPLDKHICADAWLSQKDGELATRYDELLKRRAASGESAAWRADQRAWLASRAQCKDDDACLRRRYQERLTVLDAALREPAPRGWAGHWWRVDPGGQYGARLTLAPAGARGLHISLDANAGANTGSLDGTAMLDGAGTARFAGGGKSPYGHCSLVLRRVLDRIEITQDSGGENCGAGAGVGYEGSYVAAAKDPNAPSDLLLLDLVKTPAQDAALRRLLGKKDYAYLMTTANMIDRQTATVDGRAVTAIHLFVRGLACDMKSVLMYDDAGHLWVALWEPLGGSGQQVELRYYTNVAADRGSLPASVAAEREACPGETVRLRLMP